MICDLAETYGLFNYRAISPQLLAILVLGLREESRTMLAMSDIGVPQKILLLASIADSLNFLAWTKTKDAQKNKNRPKSILETITKNHEEETAAFDSIEDYKKARERIINGGDGHGN